MSTYKINLKEQTATSINGITFKLTETKQGEYEGVCLNPSQIPPDDMDDVILDRMIIAPEERYLGSEFGEQYREYQSKKEQSSVSQQ